MHGDVFYTDIFIHLYHVFCLYSSYALLFPLTLVLIIVFLHIFIYVYKILGPSMSKPFLSKWRHFLLLWLSRRHPTALCKPVMVFHPVVCWWTLRQVMSLGHYQQCRSKSGCKGTCPLCLESFFTSEGIYIERAGFCSLDIFSFGWYLHNVFTPSTVQKNKMKEKFLISQKVFLIQYWMCSLVGTQSRWPISLKSTRF